jgi:hypothetical protein
MYDDYPGWQRKAKKNRHLGVQLNHDAESDSMSENWSVVTGRDA